MKEIKVGERVTITLEAVEQNDCDGCDDCFFSLDSTCYNPTRNDWADRFQCQSESRSDGKSIFFKEVKK